MKKLLLILSAVSVMTANAQVGVQKTDSIETGGTYLNDVYYQLGSGNKTAVANNTWQLAFRIGGQNDGIRINSATATGANDGSVVVYLYPTGTVSDWATFDTTGYKTWLKYENSDEDWEIGAFNRATGTFPDFSWGVYDMNSHVVTGDSLYLLAYKVGNLTKFKKLWIVDKTAGTWNIKYADVDGANEQTVAIKSSDYPTKNYVYHNVETNTTLDREPAKTEWDFVLTRYQAWQNVGVYAAATGILTNIGVQVAKAEDAPVSELELGDFIQDTSELINTIGYDWKYYVMNPDFSVVWFTEDSLAYFILDTKDVFWKVEFTAFGGSSNGKTVFNKTKLTESVSVKSVNSALKATSVYPNPASQNLNVLVSANNPGDVKISIYGLNGQLIDTRNVSANEGINQEVFNIAALNGGVYFVKVEGDGFVSTQKFVKQ